LLPLFEKSIQPNSPNIKKPPLRLPMTTAGLCNPPDIIPSNARKTVRASKLNEINRPLLNLNDMITSNTINKPSRLATRRCRGVAQASGWLASATIRWYAFSLEIVWLTTGGSPIRP